MKVLIVEPGKRARIGEIGDDLKSTQNAVGGYIEVVYPFEDPDVVLVCNEEGKLTGMDLNRALRSEDGEIYDIVAGTFFVAGLSEDDFTSLPDDLMEKYKKMYDLPERFARINDEFIAIKYNPQKQVNLDER